MRIAVLGTGDVGRTLASALVACGHDVVMGSRTAGNDVALAWAAESGGTVATFDYAAQQAELVINATAGVASVAVFESIDPAHLSGKTIIDVANPLDFSQGFPPRLSVCNDDSLGEQIQRTVPNAHVVKTLNTVNCLLMVNPSALGREHNIFIAGNDEDAKATTRELLAELGWRESQVLDLGDLTGARAAEMYLLLWVRLMQQQGTAQFSIKVVNS